MTGKITKTDDEIIGQIRKQIIEGNEEEDIKQFIESQYPDCNTDNLFSRAVCPFRTFST